jgi:hypothetical protein
MLSSSLRRAAWAPVAPVAGICRSSTQGLATSSAGIVRQRRYSSSSSKPSDGSRKVDASSQAPAKDVSSAGEKQGKSPRRRGKDGSGSGRNGSRSNQPNAFSNLPSVPSTQHLQPHGKRSNLYSYIWYDKSSDSVVSQMFNSHHSFLSTDQSPFPRQFLRPPPPKRSTRYSPSSLLKPRRTT